MSSAILAQVIRGNTVESLHRGHFVVMDGEKNVLASVGEPNTVTFFRSACKAIQVIPFIASGGANRFGFSEEEIALACASHSGEPVHVAVAASMLEKAGLRESDLRCGTHMPFSEREAERMIAAGERPTQLHNNCSGKHAAMLAFAQHIGADPATYDSIANPIQQEILRTIAQFSELPIESIGIGIDGCSAPNFAMPVAGMARCYTNLIQPPNSFSSDVKIACSRIVSATVRYPELIGGSERLDTILMKASSGRIISKVGAEGVWLCGILPCERHPTGLAVALKIEDGDDKRARPVVAIELLRRLEILDENQLREYSPLALKNRREDDVGRVVAADLQLFST